MLIVNNLVVKAVNLLNVYLRGLGAYKVCFDERESINRQAAQTLFGAAVKTWRMVMVEQQALELERLDT